MHSVCRVGYICFFALNVNLYWNAQNRTKIQLTLLKNIFTLFFCNCKPDILTENFWIYRKELWNCNCSAISNNLANTVGVAAGTKPSHHLNSLQSDSSFYRQVCWHAVCLFRIKYDGNLCLRTEELNLHCAVISARCLACRLDSWRMGWANTGYGPTSWDTGISYHHKGIFAGTSQPLCLCLKMASFAIEWKRCRTISCRHGWNQNTSGNLYE